MNLISEQEQKEARILAIDDEADNIRVISRALTRAGFKSIRGISDPCGFVAIFQELQPDLIILDLNMPGMDGLAVLKASQELTSEPAVPVLILTGEESPAKKREALKAGARDFVSKPFDMVEFVCRVNNLLESRLLQKKLLEQNRHLEDRVRERTQDLNDSQFEMVKRLGLAAEYRDDDTGNHICRMSEYCVITASALGLPEHQRNLLLHASALHDVGKIAIPDSILLKKGKLDAEEWSIMKSHASIGADLMSGGRCELVQMAELIARSHHERWDGGGYPNGLAGEDIPLLARIASVCDVFDALTSERPYKRAWSVEEAVAEIQRCSGAQFDPTVVEAFLSVLPQIVRTKERYSRVELPNRSRCFEVKENKKGEVLA